LFPHTESASSSRRKIGARVKKEQGTSRTSDPKGSPDGGKMNQPHRGRGKKKNGPLRSGKCSKEGGGKGTRPGDGKGIGGRSQFLLGGRKEGGSFFFGKSLGRISPVYGGGVEWALGQQEGTTPCRSSSQGRGGGGKDPFHQLVTKMTRTRLRLLFEKEGRGKGSSTNPVFHHC